ncbi:PadR family transcriptional regulator [Bacillus sp. T33-2]|uniref:PadR family transcriptional regulator n=1 Tax=Bacillus sp. T33-2 TaxID=2054168 RepID=UPI000C779A7B|nr:PadR family transcriptional regulator [Bacillus sp. T33-2]PLR97474.1 hypothetical protein CVD19_08260 [Bacillus sp. T33-2]
MSIEHSILAVISFRPSTGYDIKAEFEHKTASLYWGISYGSLYPKLKKLEEDGFITTIEEETEGRKRKLYELTGKGWKELDKWLEQPPSPPAVKDELFMKMAAWHNAADPSILAGHLSLRKKATEEMLQNVKEWKQNDFSMIDSVGMIAVKYAELKLETELNWLSESIEAILKNHLPAAKDPRGLQKKLLERRSKAMGLEGEEQDDENRHISAIKE